MPFFGGGGGAGSGGGLNTHTTSFTSQTSVTVNHNLNDLSPVVEVYDGSNEAITPDTITITSANVVTVTFAVATSGKVVIHGGAVTPTGTTSYFQQAFTSQTSVPVAHSLNQKYVNVIVYDNTDNVVEPQTIVATDSNNLTVTFATSTTGRVVVTGGATLNVLNQFITTASDPGSPVQGQIWFNTTDNQFKGYNGTSVVILG